MNGSFPSAKPLRLRWVDVANRKLIPCKNTEKKQRVLVTMREIKSQLIEADVAKTRPVCHKLIQ